LDALSDSFRKLSHNDPGNSGGFPPDARMILSQFLKTGFRTF
jgi:hypothetical protein